MMTGDARLQTKLGPMLWTVDRFLTTEECARLIQRIEAEPHTAAPITTALGPVLAPELRNNTRVIFDDQALADELWPRVRTHVPERLDTVGWFHLCDGPYRPVGVNERFRCYRYTEGQRFGPHFDGCFSLDRDEQSRDEQSRDEQSLLTFMVYLNQAMTGGVTCFLEPVAREVMPATGRALLFQHRLLHEGCEVQEGRKYVLRSDIMFRRVRPDGAPRDRERRQRSDGCDVPSMPLKHAPRT